MNEENKEDQGSDEHEEKSQQKDEKSPSGWIVWGDQPLRVTANDPSSLWLPYVER